MKSNKSIVTGKCEICGSPFHKQRDWGRFCSPKCRVKFNRRKNKKEYEAFKKSKKAITYAEKIESDSGETVNRES